MYLEEDKHGKSVSELYKIVQYCANILPRLYLLITVGAVYIKTKKVPANEVLKDLIEMCQGVQHPTRGLFLRTYLADMTKDKLPEKGSVYAENGGGDINDCIDFILKNFVEMNKLWVRMKHQAVVRDKTRRDEERKQLSILVGKNISRISSLEGVDGKIYKTKILPKLLRQIVQCKDHLAQQTLFVILIQAIPDEWHLKTLKSLFRSISKVESNVDVKQIVISLIDRLGNYIKRENIKKEKSFPLFFKSIQTLITKREEMPVDSALAMLNSLMEIVVKCYGKNKEYIDQIMTFANEHIENVKPDTSLRSVSDQMFKLIKQSMQAISDVKEILQLQSFHNLSSKFSVNHRKKLATELATNTISSTFISSLDTWKQYLEYIKPLTVDSEDDDDDDFSLQKGLISSSLHAIKTDNVEELFAMILEAKNLLIDCNEKARIIIFPAIIFALLKLLRQINALKGTESYNENAITRVLKECNQFIEKLKQIEGYRIFILNLYLSCAHSAVKCGEQQAAHSFFSKALEFYETIALNKEQFEAIRILIGTAIQLREGLGKESYNTISKQIGKLGSYLIRTTDKTRALYLCAHMFIDEPDGETKTLKCLSEATKVATSDIDVDVSLLVEIFDRNVYFIGKVKNDSELVNKIEELNNKIKGLFGEIGNKQTNEVELLKKFFENTKVHYELKKTVPQSSTSSANENTEKLENKTKESDEVVSSSNPENETPAEEEKVEEEPELQNVE